MGVLKPSSTVDGEMSRKKGRGGICLCKQKLKAFRKKDMFGNK
jgi:hypothetical protein